MKTKSLVLGSLLGLLLVLFTSTTAWAAQRELTPDGNGGYYINMPATGVDTLVIPDGVTTFNVYDDGGVSGNFSRNCNGFLVLVGPDNTLIRLKGTIRAEYDRWATASFSIHNAIDDENVYDATRNENIWWLSVGNSLITKFSNLYSRQPTEGLNLTVTLVDGEGPFAVEEVPVAGGNLIDPPATAATGDVVSVTASSAAAGYLFDHIKVKDERGNFVDVTNGTWLTGKTATFVMPASNAIVEPVYVTESQGLHLEMPYEEVSRISIPEDVESFILDGNGGEFEVSKPLVLTAPEGFLFQMEGLRSYIARTYEDGSAFYVYDGDVPDAYESQAELITGVSSSQTVTIVFVASGEFTGTMRVSLVDASQPHYINVQSSSSGSGEIEVVNYSYEGAPAGARVKIVAHPDEGYMFSGVRVLNDDSWTALDVEIVEDSVWFTMPFANVRIIPDFATVEEPYFLVPLKGVSRMSFPEEASKISICDYGGCWGYYDSDHDGYGKGTLVLTVPEGKKLYAYGDVETNRSDYLEIYDGADTNANQLAKKSGNDGVSRINSSAQSLTFRFNSTQWGNGFNINVGLIDENKKYTIDIVESEYGAVSADKENAVAGEAITLTATPNAGNVFWGVYVYDMETEEYLFYVENEQTWYGNTVQFTMPDRDVFIELDIRPTNSGSIAVPTNGTLNVDIPKFIKWITVFSEVDDDEENYYNNSNGTLVLTAPEGYALMVSYGDAVLADENDSLVIYDGNDVNANKLAKIKGGDEIGKLLSTGRSLTLQFNSDDDGTSYGIYVELILVNVSGTYSVVLDDVWGGSLTSDKETAVEGDTVTITANPNNGYMINNVNGSWISSIDGYHSLDIIGGTWYLGNEAKFVMPAGDVQIWAGFNDLEYGYFDARIPKSDTLRLDILDGMQKLDVSAQRNDWNCYYNNVDGLLVLTAPEGYGLRVNGSVNIFDESDSLIIYDGANTDAKVLAKLSDNDRNIDHIYSSRRSLAFRFKSNAEGNDDYGPSLTVSVLKNYGSGAVAIYENYNGYKIARIDGLYDGKDTVNIEEDIEVSDVEFIRNFAVTANDSGKYSTIVFPFDFNASSVSGLDDILEFSQMTEENGKLQVEMNRVWCRADVDPDRDCSSYEGNLKANTPYMLKMTDETLFFNGSDYTIKKTEPAVATSGNWQFIGTYAYKKWEKGDTDLGSVYGFAATVSNGAEIGQFVKAGSGAFIRPMRAYLKHSSSNAEPRPAPAGHVSVWRDRSGELPEEIEVVVVEGKSRAGIGSGESGSEKTTTVIGRINTRTGEFTPVTRTYDLKGRSLNAKPKAKGVYVGKKR